MTASSLQCLLKQKNVVFITVKNKEYIRVTQIERLLKQEALSYIVYSSEKSNPLTRALDLNRRIKKIDFCDADVVILGFLPQLVWKSTVRRLNGAAMAGEVKTGDAVRMSDSGTGNTGRLSDCKDGNAKSGDTKDGHLNVRVQIVSDFFLSLYDTIVLDRKLVSQKGLISKVLRKLDSRALEGSDLVITDTKADADFFATEYGVNRDKFEVLYLEADESIYSKGAKVLEAAMKGMTPENAGRQEEPTQVMATDNEESQAMTRSEMVPDDRTANDLLLDDRKEVLYFGTGLPLQGTDVVLEAFEKASPDESIKFTYIGGTKGVSKELLGRLSGRANVEMIDWLSQEELSKRIAGASLCVAGHFNADIDKADRTIPGKAYIYEAMGKTMILGDTRANHELFAEDDRHIFVKRGDSKALASAIKKSLGL